MNLTSLQRAADGVLRSKKEVGLEEYLREQIAADVAPPEIARRLLLLSDGVISVSGTTIARWIEQLDNEEAVA